MNWNSKSITTCMSSEAVSSSSWRFRFAAAASDLNSSACSCAKFAGTWEEAMTSCTPLQGRLHKENTFLNEFVLFLDYEKYISVIFWETMNAVVPNLLALGKRLWHLVHLYKAGYIRDSFLYEFVIFLEFFEKSGFLRDYKCWMIFSKNRILAACISENFFGSKLVKFDLQNSRKFWNTMCRKNLKPTLLFLNIKSYLFWELFSKCYDLIKWENQKNLILDNML